MESGRKASSNFCDVLSIISSHLISIAQCVLHWSGTEISTTLEWLFAPHKIHDFVIAEFTEIFSCTRDRFQLNLFLSSGTRARLQRNLIVPELYK